MVVWLSLLCGIIMLISRDLSSLKYEFTLTEAKNLRFEKPVSNIHHIFLHLI